MNLVSELDLPAFDHTAPGIYGDRQAPDHLVGLSQMSPNHGPAPDVS